MEMLKSKKFAMSLVGVVAVVVSSIFGFDEKATLEVLGVLVAYLFSQGLADHGKEAVKVGLPK